MDGSVRIWEIDGLFLLGNIEKEPFAFLSLREDLILQDIPAGVKN